MYIDIITGFLESGKTTFIKELVRKNCLMEYQKTILLVCEEGTTEYEEDILSDHGIEMVTVNENSELDQAFFQNIEKQYSPEHMIIEFNGTWDITALLNVKMPFTYQFRNIIFLSEGKKFHNYLCNMTAVLQPQILNSDIVLFNRNEGIDKKLNSKNKQEIKGINNRTDILYDSDASIDAIISKYFAPHEKYRKVSTGTKIGALLLISALFMSGKMLSNWYTLIQSISTIFLSILIEAIPFVLCGAIISSVIQLLIPSGWIVKKISEKKYSSFLFALIAGFFMPICDCGTVPIVSGLLKKESPLPQTMTFWLASSAVNPIVLISVYYAFPERPSLVFIRVIAGMLIAVFAGAILQISHIETKNVIKDIGISKTIGRDMLVLSYDGKLGKLEAVLKGARFEFFRVIKYLILGAFVSSFLQTVLPQAMKGLLSSNVLVQLVIMIVAAVFMSTCSTSNAFIGRSFLQSVGIIPVMSYIVLGPMLDFKNMMMLAETIKKRYLLLLAVLVSMIGYILFLVLSRYAG